jgi:hypothetical protein
MKAIKNIKYILALSTLFAVNHNEAHAAMATTIGLEALKAAQVGTLGCTIQFLAFFHPTLPQREQTELLNGLRTCIKNEQYLFDKDVFLVKHMADINNVELWTREEPNDSWSLRFLMGTINTRRDGVCLSDDRWFYNERMRLADNRFYALVRLRYILQNKSTLLNVVLAELAPIGLRNFTLIESVMTDWLNYPSKEQITKANNKAYWDTIKELRSIFKYQIITYKRDERLARKIAANEELTAQDYYFNSEDGNIFTD